MNNLQAHLDKIRSDAAECRLLSNLASEEKKTLFAKMAEHLTSLALEIENTMAAQGASMAPAAVHHEAVITVSPPTQHQRAKRSLRVIPWLIIVIVVSVVATGAVLWVPKPLEKYWLFFNLRPGHDLPQARADNANKAMPSTAAPGERKIFTEQLGALAERVANLERAIDSLTKTEQTEPSH